MTAGAASARLAGRWLRSTAPREVLTTPPLSRTIVLRRIDLSYCFDDPHRLRRRSFGSSRRAPASETAPQSYESQLNELRDIHRSADDRSQLAERIDRLLEPTSRLSEDERALLANEEVWAMYVQAMVGKAEEGKVTDLVKVLTERAERRSEVLKASAGAAAETLEQKLARYNLTPSSFLSTVFSSRSGSTASVPTSPSSSPSAAPPPSVSATAPAAMSLDDAHKLNEQFIASTRQQAQSSGSGASSSGSSSANVPPSAGAAPASEPIRVVIEENRGNVLWRVARFLGVTAVYSFILLTFLSLLMDSSGLLRATPSGHQPTEFQPNSQDRVTFAHVHGCDSAKDELSEFVDFLKDPARFARLGGKLPRGVLLTGPPGTGKTLLARAVAGEAGVQFFIASGSEFDEMFVGVGARRIRELFAAARKNAPAIIFIDELDAIGGRRSPKDQHYAKQTLNQLLVELDGFQQHEGVILMAATNFPQALDKALTRPGRFDRHVAVPLPDARGRIQILKHHTRKVTIDPDLDLSIVARGTPGFSGADIQNLVNQAAVKASREGALLVSRHHFEWARDRIMMGAENKSYIATPEQKRHTAYHEAGHALVSIYTPGATPLHKVTCLRRGHALGLTHFLPELDKSSESFLEYRARLDVSMGGRAAEELLLGKDNITSGATSDIDSATRIATAMVRQMGFSEELGPRAYREDEVLSTQTLSAIEAEVRQMIEAAQQRAFQILSAHRIELDRLAAALIEWETLDAEEARAVIKGVPLERDVL